MGVELTEYVSHDTGRLTGRFVGVEVQLGAHIVEDASMHRFESVPHVGKRTRYDHRHRIIDVGRLHLLLDVDRDYLSLQSGILFFFS